MMNGLEFINDDGYDLEIRLEDEEDHGMAEYTVRWYNPVVNGEYRFVIAARKGQESLSSQSFRIAADDGLTVSFVD